MYSIYDYAYNGLLYLNNVMRPRHKRLSQLMIYSTTACQSQCKHCNIWQKKVEHLSLDDIRRIMQSKCLTKRTTVGLEGGEFILHPQAAEIMAWFRKHHPNYTLLSNCLAPRRVIDAVRLYQPRHPTSLCSVIPTSSALLNSPPPTPGQPPKNPSRSVHQRASTAFLRWSS